MPEYAHRRKGRKRIGGHRMSTAGPAGTATEGGDLAEQRVTPLELFFDLVFVFALTQVTGFLADHLTWSGMLQGAALLAALWWAWGGCSWPPSPSLTPSASMGCSSGWPTSWCGSCRCSCTLWPPAARRRRAGPSS